MNKEDKELQKHLIDEMMKVYKTNPDVMIYMEALMKKYEEKEQEIERLNNIIKPKEVNYNYLKFLFKKKDKEEVIKFYVYKCEQLEKLYKSYEEKEIEVMKKDNIINELEKWLKEYSEKDTMSSIIFGVVLNHLIDLKGEKNEKD